MQPQYSYSNLTYNLRDKGGTILKGILVLNLILVLLLLFYVNVLLISKHNTSLREIITILVLDRKASDATNQIKSILELAPVKRAIWICFASIIASIALVVGNAFVQSFTQNPLADSTTLGFIDATIFGIIFMKGVIGDWISAENYLLFYSLFAFIGGIITLCIINLIIKKPRYRDQHLQIIFIGLVMNMMFKTFNYLIRSHNSNSTNTSFNLMMGGAENIYSLYSKQFECLKWTAIIILIALVLSVLFSNKLNLFELGEEQAKTLGVNVRLFKQFGYLMVLITTTISIILVGNVAFIGLISTHIVRHVCKTRKYHIIILAGAMISSILLLFGVFLNSLFPFISSSIFILFLGGCMMLFLSSKNKNV